MACRYSYNPEHILISSLDDDLRNINPVCLDILYHSGFKTSEAIRNLLFPSYAEAIRPLACRDKERAIICLANAVKENIPITVYRDYDTDGITAGAVAVSALENLGVTTHCYANDRNIDGYGICRNGIDNILARWSDTRIILTVDNGIVGNEAVDYADSKGLTVIITDHHEQGKTLPNAHAVVDLKRRDEIYPYRDLCGCGLIYRIMLDLYRTLQRDPAPVLKLIDLVALATVADVVPLLGENRALVKEGIRQIESCERSFFKIINKICGIKKVTSSVLGFQFAPALNALSRLGLDTDIGVQMLLSQDEKWLEREVTRLLEINQQRKNMTKAHLDIALKQLKTTKPSTSIILANPKFDNGIVGITAGQLKEQYWRPSIVFAPASNGILSGSARSIDKFDLKANLDLCADLLEKYGGHTKAAGLSLKESNLQLFTERFTGLTDRAFKDKKPVHVIPLAAVLDETEITENLIQDLSILEPFGEGFPEPVFGLKAKPDGIRYMGSENQHVKLTCSSSGLSIILWNKANSIDENALPVKFTGKPELNYWNGKTTMQFLAN